jgi:D-threo-aldose 1-dehydrogenase
VSGSSPPTALAPLGFGCAQLFRLHSARERETVLAAAYDAGIRHFDVAPLYGLGQAETELGRFLRGRRDAVTVTTKFGLDPAAGMSAVRVVQGMARRLVNAVPPLKRYLKNRRRPLARSQSFEPKVAQASLERSLRRLNTEWIDYFLLHEPTADLVARDQPVEFLQQQKKRGLIRAFGVAGPVAPLAEVIARHPALADIVQHPAPPLGERSVALPRAQDQTAFIYGAVGPRLEAIKTMLASNPEACEELQGRFGHERSRRLARLLLLEQRTGRPKCLALFGSTSVPHITEMVAPPSSHESDLVTWLRQWATGLNPRRL